MAPPALPKKNHGAESNLYEQFFALIMYLAKFTVISSQLRRNITSSPHTRDMPTIRAENLKEYGEWRLERPPLINRRLLERANDQGVNRKQRVQNNYRVSFSLITARHVDVLG